MISLSPGLCEAFKKPLDILKAGGPKISKNPNSPTVPKLFRGDPVGFGDRSYVFPGLLGGLSNLMYGICEIPTF